MKFSYTAVNGSGTESRGECDADNERAAAASISNAGLFAVKIQTVKPALTPKLPKKKSKCVGNGVELASIALWLPGISCLLIGPKLLTWLAIPLILSGAMTFIYGALKRAWYCPACGNGVEQTSKLCPTCKISIR